MSEQTPTPSPPTLEAPSAALSTDEAPDEPLELMGSVATMPSFSVGLRGYKIHEVDRYAQAVEADLGALEGERNDLRMRVRNMADQLREAHAEIADLRRRPSLTDKITYQHLGVRVEQIFAEAEQHADTVRRAAMAEADQVRTRLATELDHARQAYEQEYGQARETYEREYREARETYERQYGQAHARQEEGHRALAEARRAFAVEERDTLARLERARAELGRVQVCAERQRADAEAVLRAAQDAYDRVHTSAMAASETVHARLAAQARDFRDEALREANEARHAADAYAQRRVAEADEQARRARPAAAAASTGPAGPAGRKGKQANSPGRASADRSGSARSGQAGARPNTPDTNTPSRRVSSGNTPKHRIR